jgi:hypothetical protein
LGLDQFFDLYTLRARVLPGAVAAVAPAVALASWSPTLRESSTSSATLAALVAIAVGMVLAHIVGARGKQLEPSLWASWDGCPTTQLLRHGDPSMDEIRRLHYHRILAALFPDTVLPTAAEQSSDPSGADSRWALLTERLRSRTRDKKTFGHLFSENCAYGCWRNLLSIRKLGAVAALAAFALAAGRMAYVKQTKAHLEDLVASAGKFAGPSVDELAKNLDAAAASAAKGIDDFATAAVLLAFMAVGFFLIVLRPALVKVAAFRYASRLLEAGEVLISERDGNDDGKGHRRTASK